MQYIAAYFILLEPSYIIYLPFGNHLRVLSIDMKYIDNTEQITANCYEEYFWLTFLNKNIFLYTLNRGLKMAT